MGSGPLAYLAYPPTGAGHPVMVLHSWWGLTDSFRCYADRLADAGFLAGCVDLYDGAVAADEDEVRRLRSRPRSVPMYRWLLAAVDAVRSDPGAISQRTALVGFSMGGHWAIWLAQRPEVQASAVVVYYATRSVRRGSPAVPVMAHFAGPEDPFVTASGRRAMERSLLAAGWPYTATDHPGAGHWFAETDNAAYDERAADDAFAQTRAFLQGAS